MAARAAPAAEHSSLCCADHVEAPGDAVTALNLVRDGSLFVLRMRGEGLVDLELLSALGHALDEVEASEGPACWILRGEDTRFSAGFAPKALAGEDAGQTVSGAIRLLARLLAFPVPSAAAVNGHAFGIGAMLALACDFQVMREDRGWWCLPEIDLGLPLAPGMTALLQQKLEPRSLTAALLGGRRFGGAEAAACGLVDEAAPEAQLEARCRARIEPLAGKRRGTYAALKRGLYRHTLEVIAREHG